MAHFFKYVDIEVIIGVFALVWPAKTGLKSEGVCDSHLFPHNDARCCFFCLLNLEWAVWVVKHV